MKGSKAVILIVGIAIIAIAAVVVSITVFFQNNQAQNEGALILEGTVAKVEDARILVIRGKEVDELKGKTEDEMLEGVSEAIWFSLSIDQIKRVDEFDKVRISYSQVAETFPGRASANSVVNLSDE